MYEIGKKWCQQNISECSASDSVPSHEPNPAMHLYLLRGLGVVKTSTLYFDL